MIPFNPGMIRARLGLGDMSAAPAPSPLQGPTPGLGSPTPFAGSPAPRPLTPMGPATIHAAQPTAGPLPIQAGPRGPLG